MNTFSYSLVLFEENFMFIIMIVPILIKMKDFSLRFKLDDIYTEIFVIRKHPNSSFHIISACIEHLPGFSQLNVRYYLPLVSPAFNSILSVCCHDFFLQGRKVHIAICCLPHMGRRFNIFYIKKMTSIFWYYKFVFWYQEFFFHIRNSNWFFNIKIYIFWYHNYK